MDTASAGRLGLEPTPFIKTQQGEGLIMASKKETPMTAQQLPEVIADLSDPGFYLNPTSITEVVDFVAGKLLDLLKVPHCFDTRWDPKNLRPPTSL